MMQDFRAYLELVPGKPEAYRMLGLGHLKKGSYRLAVHNLTRAIDLEPGYTAAYANRAEAHRLTADYEAAVSDATRTTPINRITDFMTLAPPAC